LACSARYGGNGDPLRYVDSRDQGAISDSLFPDTPCGSRRTRFDRRFTGRNPIATPYHGWLKNVANGLSGKWHTHHDPRWEDGDVSFWSPATLTKLSHADIEQAGTYPAACQINASIFDQYNPPLAY